MLQHMALFGEGVCCHVEATGVGPEPVWCPYERRECGRRPTGRGDDVETRGGGELPAEARGPEPSLTVRSGNRPWDLDLRRPASELGTNRFLSSQPIGLRCSISTALAN